MKKVYIWGTGINGKKVLECINHVECEVLGYIDNNPDKQGEKFVGFPIVSYSDILGKYDYIIVSVINYSAILYQLELEGYKDFDRIIIFYDSAFLEKEEYIRILNKERWRISLLEYKIKILEDALEYRTRNIGYEIIDKWSKGEYWYPQIGKTEEAIEKIVNEGYSMIRFGDGEFEIMAGNERPIFQKYDNELSGNLRKIINSDNSKILIAIANNYGNLEQYTHMTADGIREYMNEEVRLFHQTMLRKDKVYYDAYMFKTYMPYKNKEETEKRVELVKRIWDNKDIIIIEGRETRTGVGNDLFDNVKTIKRLLAPTQNAYSIYNKILSEAIKLNKEALILTVLGPAGKILTYDMVQAGYQVVDIGQIDMDYEWYKAGRGTKVPIPNKYVSQLPPTKVEDIIDEKYKSEIIAVID